MASNRISEAPVKALRTSPWLIDLETGSELLQEKSQQVDLRGAADSTVSAEVSASRSSSTEHKPASESLQPMGARADMKPIGVSTKPAAASVPCLSLTDHRIGLRLPLSMSQGNGLSNNFLMLNVDNAQVKDASPQNSLVLHKKPDVFVDDSESSSMLIELESDCDLFDERSLQVTNTCPQDSFVLSNPTKVSCQSDDSTLDTLVIGADGNASGEAVESPTETGSTSPLDSMTDEISHEGQPNTIRAYYEKSETLSDASWRTMPELPTSAEVGQYQRFDLETTNDIAIPMNLVDRPWSDKQTYLSAHYELLREDAVGPLREAVRELHLRPYMKESQSHENAGIYEKVYITGLTFAQQGIAVRVEFSLLRTEKKVKWEQSKRLTTGTVVALSPVEDMFNKVIKVAVVAARPIVGLLKRPHTIDIMFNSLDELEIDPQQEWIMVESKSSYYEAHRHTMCALQKMYNEKFPMSEYLVDLVTDIKAPNSLQKDPLMDFSAVLSDKTEDPNINILEQWPDLRGSSLDWSQQEALRRILSKRLSVIQGPPGTGKTYVSVMALKILLSNLSAKDPPIIVTAQTNHALDQLLRLIAEFEPSFVRIGGRTTDQVVIEPRTLFEIRKRSPRGKYHAIASARKLRAGLSAELRALLDPLHKAQGPFSAEFLQSCELLTQKQVQSMIEHDEHWEDVNSSGAPGIISSWLDNSLVYADREQVREDQFPEAEEPDLPFEKLGEIEAESMYSGDDSFELLRGEWLPLSEPWTGRYGNFPDQELAELLRDQQDMHKIPHMYRGPIYRYLQKRGKKYLLEQFRASAAEYSKLAHDLKIAKWERDYTHLRNARVIGMTTTGLSKYRGLLSSLQPKIVLIEEAGEIFEASVTAACFETLERLILVGDHQQLRAQCAVQALGQPPFNLNISLFERLVKNDVEYSQLTRQRRSRPEISRLIKPIYEQLEDHPCVKARGDVPGMGKVNSWFYSHEWLESNDNYMSKQNTSEADMIIAFFNYLVLNGVAPEKITVLTFYNGQRKLILRGLERLSSLVSCFELKVFTVDSYQGEENDVVLLSLVRYSSKGGIGFVANDNRVCVALSRARRGFYVFGNARLLARASLLWRKVLEVMGSDPIRVGYSLPITCSNHGKTSQIKHPSEFENRDGGCKNLCGGTLQCGHPCTLQCHPYPHSLALCNLPCPKVQEGCKHQCLERCHNQYKPCRCSCKDRHNAASQLPPRHPVNDDFSKKTPGVVTTNEKRTDLIRRFERQQDTILVVRSIGSTPTKPKRSASETKPMDDLGAPQMDAWTAYAAGGHVESDRELAKDCEKRLANTKLKAQVNEIMKGLFGKDCVSKPVEASSAIESSSDEDEVVGNLVPDPFIDPGMATPLGSRRNTPQQTCTISFQEELLGSLQKSTPRRRTRVVSEYLFMPATAQEESLLD